MTKMDLETKAINAIRFLSADGVQQAKSGHPGLPMGAAAMAYTIWTRHLTHNPSNPQWSNRDRFILSGGHGSMLLYSLLYLTGYDLPLDELKNFRQWNSLTPGHPEYGHTPGVEVTTGPLGQGFANGVGLALSAKMLGDKYSQRLFRYRVFGIVSDGDLMEGVASEAASLAGHLGLDNLVYIYDDNNISIGGSTDICFTESVPERFKSYGWFVQSVDGHNLEDLCNAIQRAVGEEGKPALICARTTIGFGSPNKAGSADVHGSPLGEDELKLTRQALGWQSQESFVVPEAVAEFCKGVVEEKTADYLDWKDNFEEWNKEKPELAAAFKAQASRQVPSVLENELIETFSEAKKEATRASSGRVIQVLAKHLPYLTGGSADLEPSNKTLIKDSTDVQARNFSGRNLRFGIREHAMGAIANGLAYDRCWVPYTGTFLVFADYMRPAIRLAALSKLQTLFIFTHDSFQVGEDGPTHQPVEHIASLRIIPGLYVFRPADALESAMSYLSALRLKNAPSTLLFSRQSLPALERGSDFSAEDISRGAYVVQGKNNEELVIVATGSEVSLAIESARLLEKKGFTVRVVSMPCMELFLEQDKNYQAEIIPPGAKKVSIEAGVTTGWEKIVGADGLCTGLENFGASAPAGVLAEKFGFTPSAVVENISRHFNL